jgi:hypothetical protein
MKKYTKIQIINIIAFLIVPIISSFISTYHIVNFFQIGNSFALSMFLSISFELGALASAISITILDKISKFVTWAIFLILIVFQIIGNVYYTFEYIVRQEVLDPKYLDVPARFIAYFLDFETTDEIRMFLSILIGIPIPLISLAFLKTLVDYISNHNDEEVKSVEVSEEVKEETSPEILEVDETIEDVYNLEENSEEEPQEEVLEYNKEEVKDVEYAILDEITTQINLDEKTTEQENEILKGDLKKLKGVVHKLNSELVKTYPQVYGETFKPVEVDDIIGGENV